MRVTRALYERFAPGSDESLFQRSLDIRLAEMCLGAGRFGLVQWLVDRVLFLVRAHHLPARHAQRDVEPVEGATWAYDPGSASPAVRAYRGAFLDRCLSVAARFVGGDEPVRIANGRAAHAVFREARRMAWRALFDPSFRRWRWLVDVYADLALVAPLDGIADTLYVFQLSYARPYLVASWLDAHTSIGVCLVTPGVPLFRDNRYIHLVVPLVLTSRAQVPEVDFYRARGWIMAGDVRYAGPEFALDLVDLPESDPLVHVGFFSSGEWARVEGLIQSTDIDAISRGDYATNPFARRSEAVVGALAEYCKRNGLTLRMYPHPYERMLMNLHGITPPYARLADGDRITLDVAEGTSRSRMHEPLVAVSLQSSFIWERLDLGLRHSFIHSFNDEALDVVLAESLGEYQANVFTSTDELIEKIDGVLAEAEGAVS